MSRRADPTEGSDSPGAGRVRRSLVRWAGRVRRSRLVRWAQRTRLVRWARSVRWARVALSVFVVGHLWAVVAEPFRFASRGPTGPSPAAAAFHGVVAPYSEFAYLNHGYAFFAPNPGPSHLVRARWTTDEGSEATETFPDRTRQWPRLLYHRHFMLTEFLHNLHQPRELPREALGDERTYELWRERRRLYEMVEGSFVGHLENRYGAADVRVERVEHRMPGLPEFIEEQMQLDDPRLYRTLPDAFGPPPDMPWEGP